MGLFNHFPYSDTEEVNLDYTLTKLDELYSRGEDLYAELQAWKTNTDKANEAWKSDLLSDINEWQNSVTHSLEEWKTSVDSEVSNALTTLSNQISAELAQAKTELHNEVADLASAAAASAADATASQSAAAQSAETAINSAAAAAQSEQNISASAEQIETNKDDIADLKSALNGITATNLLNGTIYTENKYVSFNDGILYNSAITDVTDYIDISQSSELVYSRLEVPSSATYIGIAFYDGEKTFISGQRCIRSMPTYNYVLQSVAVPENAKFIVMSVAKSTTITDNAFLYDSANYKESLVGTVDVIKADIAQINIDIGGINSTDGWYNLPSDYFIAGDWMSYKGTSSRKYRIRTVNAVSFSRDVVLLAKAGYYLSVLFSGGENKDAVCCVDVPADTEIKINIRRIYENTDETADIDSFAKMLLVSSGFSGMEKYKSTFTDVTMFPRIGISGDSYSAGGGIISGVQNLTWGKNLERESGVVVDIYAKSGESIQQWTSDETGGLPALLAGEECGLYWFAHGINGTSTDAAIGTPADMSTEPKPQTFYGQYVYAIETIQRVFPRARIVIATIVGTGYSLYQTNYAKVNTAIRNIAEYCRVPLIDLPEDDFYKSNWYDSHHRSNHPTAMLNAGIAHANRRLLTKCIMENPDYFIDYGDKYVFAASCQQSTEGKITATPSIAASGSTITLSNVAYSGYSFIRYESDDVEITGDTFVMPNKNVTIRGVFS